MAVKLYDEALLEKLKSWTTDTALQVYSTDSAGDLFKVLGDQGNDKAIKLPLIVLRRNGGFTIKNSTKRLLVYDGKSIEWTIDKAVQLNAIPIGIDYQIDIYARKQEECDEIVRNLIFNLIIFPDLNIELPYYGKHYQHKSHVSISSDVANNSDIPERLSFGQFTRFTLSLSIDDAYLFDVRERQNYSININMVEDTEIPVEDENRYSFNINLKTEN